MFGWGKLLGKLLGSEVRCVFWKFWCTIGAPRFLFGATWGEDYLPTGGIKPFQRVRSSRKPQAYAGTHSWFWRVYQCFTFNLSGWSCFCRYLCGNFKVCWFHGRALLEEDAAGRALDSPENKQNSKLKKWNDPPQTSLFFPEKYVFFLYVL